MIKEFLETAVILFATSWQPIAGWFLTTWQGQLLITIIVPGGICIIVYIYIKKTFVGAVRKWQEWKQRPPKIRALKMDKRNWRKLEWNFSRLIPKVPRIPMKMKFNIRWRKPK